MKKAAFFIAVSFALSTPCVFAQDGEESLRAVRQQKKAELSGSRWVVQIKPMRGGGEAVEDLLMFEDVRVTSRAYQKRGYQSSGYSVRTVPDGSIILEMMQTHDEEGVVFWKGEWRGERILGVISEHPNEGSSTDYSFTALEQDEQAEVFIKEVVPKRAAEQASETFSGSVPAGTQSVMRPQAPQDAPEPLPWWRRFFKK